MTESVVVDVQLALGEDQVIEVPDVEKIQQWAAAAFDAWLKLVDGKNDHKKDHDTTMTVRIVEEAEISQLNKDFRHKIGPTNVLSFPFSSLPGIPVDETYGMLGDLAVCATIVNKEASDQHKENNAHWAHIIIHGSLHLLGYDHQNDKEAGEMESLETAILSSLGFPDPY